jgi:hypothetical protein
MYHKRIVVDFDDTLAFHKGRDFDNAIPNTDLIAKLNDLYDQGWQIDIFTARGSISCKTREEAREKYEASIKGWLQKYNVKYNLLSFDKPLAAYYIDDKGIMPEDFLKVDIRELEGGLSGTEIFTDGKVVHKQDPNAHATSEWFNEAFVVDIKTPMIHRVVGQTITMDYIEHDEEFFFANYYVAMGLIQTQLEKMKSLPASDLKFESYIKRIEEHARNSGQKTLIENAMLLHNYDLESSFSHGDFGIKNMLFKDHDLYLIDPICGVFGCTEIDAAKFCASLIINEYPESYIRKSIDFMAAVNDINKRMLQVLIASEVTRVYKYHPRKDFIMECVYYVHEQS